jgi:hypothetical protein
MDISGGIDAENRNLVVHGRHGRINQQFDLIYAENWREDPKKGQLNRYFGLYVERDFHIQSGLSAGRYIDILGRNLVIKTQNGRKTQVFYFHRQSRTIRSKNNNQSIDITSSGRSTNLHVWSTNSNWW